MYNLTYKEVSTLIKECRQDHPTTINFGYADFLLNELDNALAELATIKQQMDTQRIRLLQYESLRRNFRALIHAVLGESYYNMGADVYNCDYLCCADIASKCRKLEKYEIYAAIQSEAAKEAQK